MRNSALCPRSLFVLVMLASCAPSAPNAVAPKAATPTASFSNGTILSMRDIAPTLGSEPWRAALLAAAASTSPAGGRPTLLVEFIVRSDDGATLSLVQDNSLGLHPGDRVVIRREANAQLTRPS